MYTPRPELHRRAAKEAELPTVEAGPGGPRMCRGPTEDSQRTQRGLTEDSQRARRGPTQRIHRGFAEDLPSEAALDMGFNEILPA